MLWVGLAAVRGLLTEEVSEAEFDVAHPQYTLDGAVAQFAGQGQDIRGDIPKLSVLVVHAVQLASLGGRRPFIAPAADLLGSPARRRSPRLLVLHAKSSPALAPLFVACNTPVQTM